MKPTLYAIIAAMLVLIGFWLSGFNFDERGEAAEAVVLAAAEIWRSRK